jgi:Ricin-type beta-trefoil lectin domain
LIRSIIPKITHLIDNKTWIELVKYNNRLQTPFTGKEKCLNIINDGENNKLIMAKCSKVAGQLWRVKLSKTTLGNSGYYFVINELIGPSNCLNVVNDGRNNKLTMTNCDNISGQSWEITRMP